MREKINNNEMINYDVLNIENRMLKRKVKLIEKELEKWKDTEKKPINIDKELITFIAGISHSLKNELILLKTTTDRMQKDINISDINLKKDINTILSSTQFSDILLGNLMYYLGYGEIVYKPFSFVEILEELVPLILPRLPKNIKLETDIHINNLKIFANKDQIKQIILNLVNNAIWAMSDKEEGILKIACHKDFREKEYLQIEVSDNGIGIPSENIQKVFNLDFSTKREGWGMGLYLTKLIIDKHEGEVFIESEVGKGTKVIINLPIYKKNN
jgi:signal transduction histidine kinase